MYDHLTTISTAMNQLGWSNYANDHEDGNGQFEQNFQFAEALITADRVVTLRYLLSMIAAERGMIATFMPKPFADRTGSGLHLPPVPGQRRVSPVFPDGDDARRGWAFRPPLTRSSRASSSTPARCRQSSDQRSTPSGPARSPTASGASWAPRTPTYGGNDRTHYVRVPDDQRVELRGGDGSANPYLAIAAALGAGIDGIKRSLDPGAVGANGRPTLPPTLLHAVDELASDPVISGVLDSVGDGVASYFGGLKRDEFFAYHSSVSPWEIDQYLTAF